MVLPGEYRVRVSVGDVTSEAALSVRPDPRQAISLQDRRSKLEALQEAAAWVRLGGLAQERLEGSLEAVDGILTREGRDADPEIMEAGQRLTARLRGAMEKLFTGPPCQGICGGDPVMNSVRRAQSYLSSSSRAPSANDRTAMAEAEAALRTILDEVNRILTGPLTEFSAILREAGYSPLPDLSPLGPVGGG
jgi:hypothetical protein